MLVGSVSMLESQKIPFPVVTAQRIVKKETDLPMVIRAYSNKLAIILLARSFTKKNLLEKTVILFQSNVARNYNYPRVPLILLQTSCMCLSLRDVYRNKLHLGCSFVSFAVLVLMLDLFREGERRRWLMFFS